ncbi:MAG: type III-A CRISPR-associated RAMP protein Csm4 [Methanobrevibacter sp.]|jgi:CRISPR-associated protein Csm4|nr:type III-A CRISPR-associated RAMP protein Csm4 [Methanobrevibacter sp.]
MLVYIKPLSLFPKLHSDTIFGAIISAISELYPENIEEILSKFKVEYHQDNSLNDEPPFLISSAFPYLFNDNEKIRFFPKIISSSKSSTSKNFDESSNILDNRKKFKKIEFFEEELFLELASGNLNEENIILNLDDYYISGNLLSKNPINIDGRCKESLVPNNSINRITCESEAIFYTEGNEFKNMGLFFLVEFKNEKYLEILKSAIRFLKDRGFGSNISVGKGHFDFEFDDEYCLIPNSLENGEYFTTLSRFIPNNNDLINIDETSSYELDSKRGKSREGELRKQVKFFKEGSVFPKFSNFYGKMIDSGLNYPAIEYGFAFPVKFNCQEE